MTESAHVVALSLAPEAANLVNGVEKAQSNINNWVRVFDKVGFEKISFLKRMRLSQKQLEQYYLNKRKFEYDNGINIKGIYIRKILHKVILSVLKMECLFSGIKVNVIGDQRVHTDRPVIYASTHIGRYDVESNFLALKDHFYIFYGDPGLVYKNMDGLLLYFNGVIYADTDSKSDRLIGKETCIKLLKQGGNLLIYPEGAWNITENQVVMKLFTGTVEMAIRGQADIVPIAMEQYGNVYHVNIGKNIDYSMIPLEKKREKSDELRDILCTLRWEIWERAGITKRVDIPKNYKDIFLKNIMSQSPSDYTVEDIIRTRYQDEKFCCDKIQ